MKHSLTLPMTHFGSIKGVNPFLKVYNNLLAEFKRLQIGYATIAILGQSCTGSAAVMFLLLNELPVTIKMSLLFLVTILCMAFNAAVLAQLKVKTTFNLLLLSVGFSGVVIMANLI